MEGRALKYANFGASGSALYGEICGRHSTGYDIEYEAHGPEVHAIIWIQQSNMDIIKRGHEHLERCEATMLLSQAESCFIRQHSTVLYTGSERSNANTGDRKRACRRGLLKSATGEKIWRVKHVYSVRIPFP